MMQRGRLATGASVENFFRRVCCRRIVVCGSVFFSITSRAAPATKHKVTHISRAAPHSSAGNAGTRDTADSASHPSRSARIADSRHPHALTHSHTQARSDGTSVLRPCSLCYPVPASSAHGAPLRTPPHRLSSAAAAGRPQHRYAATARARRPRRPPPRRPLRHRAARPQIAMKPK